MNFFCIFISHFSYFFPKYFGSTLYSQTFIFPMKMFLSFLYILVLANKSVDHQEEEVIKLEKSVRAEGTVELWLMALLVSAKESLHSLIRSAFHIISESSFDMLDFIRKYQAQVGILGIQVCYRIPQHSFFSLLEV